MTTFMINPSQPELTNIEAQRFIAWCNDCPIDELRLMLRDWCTVYELPECCAFLHYHRIMVNTFNARTGLNVAHWNK